MELFDFITKKVFSANVIFPWKIITSKKWTDLNDMGLTFGNSLINIYKEFYKEVAVVYTKNEKGNLDLIEVACFGGKKVQRKIVSVEKVRMANETCNKAEKLFKSQGLRAILVKPETGRRYFHSVEEFLTEKEHQSIEQNRRYKLFTHIKKEIYTKSKI